jgi:hypothetical protein
MPTLRVLTCAVVLLFVGLGCGPRLKEETVAVTPIDPMNLVKATLQNYVNGQPLASEVMGFDSMVEDVRKVYPDKADILKKGLDEIKAVKGSPKAKAAELLKKLGLDAPAKK